MAQVNITLNDEEILQVFTGDREEAIRFLLERILNEMMKAESEEQLKASLYESSPLFTIFTIASLIIFPVLLLISYPVRYVLGPGKSKPPA